MFITSKKSIFNTKNNIKIFVTKAYFLSLFIDIIYKISNFMVDIITILTEVLNLLFEFLICNNVNSIGVCKSLALVATVFFLSFIEEIIYLSSSRLYLLEITSFYNSSLFIKLLDFVVYNSFGS